MTIFERALQYLELGLSVIPIEPNGKKPTVRWEQYQKRRMTEAEAKIVFKSNSNIALVCGKPSGVVVVDVDSYKRESGIEIVSPLVVLTPRGGEHKYFKYKEARNTANAELATDIRGDGGYVLLPDSTINGIPYKWADREPSALLLMSLPELDTELSRKIYKLDEKEKSGTSDHFEVTSALNLSEGSRNDKLHRMALSLLAKYQVEEAWEFLVVANNSAVPPLQERELRTLWNSALKRFQASPPVRVSVIPKPNENQAFKFTSFNEDIDNAAKVIREGLGVGIRSGFASFDRIAGGFFPGQSYLFFADTSVGKSVYLLNSLMYLAKRGEKVMYFDLENSFSTMTSERMVLINENNTLTKPEWDALPKDKKVELVEKLKDLPFCVWDQGKLGERFGNIVWKEGVEKCIKEGVAQGCRIFAIDHLHYFEGAEQNHNLLAAISKDINDLAARNNIVILMVAHTKKGLIKEKGGRITPRRPTIDFVSGSGLITRNTKNVIGLQRNHQAVLIEDQRETWVYIDKTKHGPTGSFRLEFNPYTLKFFDDLLYPPEEENKLF